jgi:hypothetical protein
MAGLWIIDVAAGVVRAVLADVLVEGVPTAWTARTGARPRMRARRRR